MDAREGWHRPQAVLPTLDGAEAAADGTEAAGLNAGKPIAEWVFLTGEGTVVDGDNLRNRVFYKLLEKAGVRQVRLHDLRHTYASLLIQQGESLAYVQKQLGHSSIQVTVDIYGHLIPGANR